MQIKINKRSIYAPIRYEATRPYAVSIGRAFAGHARKGEKARLAFVHDSLFTLVKNAVTRIGAEQGPGPVQGEMSNVQIFGIYNQAGRVIYDMRKPLTTALLMTDVEDIPCGELVFPSEAFYLHFGQLKDLSVDGLAVEGAFVMHDEGRMIFDLVPAGFGQPHFFALPMGEPLIGVRIDTSDVNKSIDQALTDSIADIIDGNQKVFQQMEEIKQRLSAQYGGVVKVPSPVHNLKDREPLLRRATALIVNSLFYIAAEPSDVNDDWGSDTPEEAASALRNARNPGEVRTIENTLLKAGYSKVKFVGRAFASTSESKAIEESMQSGRHVAAHFRRGHFRRQAYGPEHSLRKRIFVAPVMVNGNTESIAPGRIYDVQ